MKLYLFLFMLFSFFSLFGQIDFEKHINSIVKTEDGQRSSLSDQRAVRYAIKYLRDNGIKKKYITNRKLLNEVKLYECVDFFNVYFYNKLEDNLRIEVIIDFEQIVPEDYEIQKIDGINKIDGHIAYGSYHGNPSVRIASIDIRYNKESISIPESAYSKFYEIIQCNGYDYPIKPIEVYSSDDGEYVFIYINGGRAADTYFAKLIFSRKEGYITDIVADYVILSRLGAFKEGFIGF